MTAVATSIVAYAEARAAFARKRREGASAEDEYLDILSDFERDWPRYLVIEASEAVIKSAGDLAERQAPRTFDGIHLASAVMLQERIRSRVTFSCADQRLQAAAQDESLESAWPKLKKHRSPLGQCS